MSQGKPITRRTENEFLSSLDNTDLREQLYDDLRDAATAGALVHHLNITAFADLDLFDFSKMAQLIEAGRLAAAHATGRTALARIIPSISASLTLLC